MIFIPRSPNPTRQLKPALDVRRTDDLHEGQGCEEDGRGDDHDDFLDLPAGHRAGDDRAGQGDEDGDLDAEAGEVGAQGDDVARLAVADLVALHGVAEEEVGGSLEEEKMVEALAKEKGVGFGAGSLLLLLLLLLIRFV